MRLVTTSDLDRWANSREAQSQLPLLMRRLILAADQGIKNITFPGGDSVFKKGWDGELVSTEGNSLTPKGKSLWEMGVNKDFKGKAEKDYEKRKNKPGVDNPKDHVFVFVTPRRWQQKEQWAKDKVSEGFWGDVLVLDGDDLEIQLEQNPALGCIMARELKILTGSFDSAQEWWNEWSNATVPPITANLIIAGRSKEKEEVLKWFASGDQELTIRGATKHEAMAFAIACFTTLDSRERENFVSKGLIVRDQEALNSLVTISNHLYVFNNSEDIESKARLLGNGHRIITPIGFEEFRAHDAINLSIPKGDTFTKELTDSGISRHQANYYARESGRSFSVLRRLLMTKSNKPNWVKEGNVRALLAALLVGRWDENYDGDKQILSELAGQEYEQVARTLHYLTNISDRPLYHIGQKWQLVSPLDAWFTLAPLLSIQDLDKLEEVFEKVITTHNPIFDLEIKERPLSNIHGKRPVYSGRIRKGITQTLTLIGVFGSSRNLQPDQRGQSWVDTLVYRVLQRDEAQYWQSLDGIMPELAEASPYSFLTVIENALNKPDSAISSVFEEGEGFLTPISYHSGLLWGLEALAWNPQYLDRVVGILIGLDAIDPQGKLANRPINSLLEIFTMWRPQTLANANHRQKILNRIKTKNPELAWRLLVSLLQKEVGHENHFPRWRMTDKILTAHLDQGVQNKEFAEGLRYCFSHLSDLVGTDTKRWIELLNLTRFMYPEDIEKLTTNFKSTQEFNGDQQAFLTELRDFISKHRSYPGTNWALRADLVNQIETVFFREQSEGFIQRHEWLFTEMPNLLEGRENFDYKEHQAICDNKRCEVLKELVEKSDFHTITKLANSVHLPALVGKALKEASGKSEEESVLTLFQDMTFGTQEMLKRYVLLNQIDKGLDWANVALRFIKSLGVQPKAVSNFLDALPMKPEVWDLVDTQEPEGKKTYWEDCYFYFSELSIEDFDRGLSSLLQANRHIDALECISLNFKQTDFPAPLILKVLHSVGMAKEDKSRNSQLREYSLQQIFENLYSKNIKDREKLERVEWLYLEVLTAYDSKVKPVEIFSRLSSDPEYFVGIVSYAYMPANRKKGEIDYGELTEKQFRGRASKTFNLLRRWDSIPGTRNSGIIDVQVFLEWFKSAKEGLIRTDREQVGYHVIGNMLGLTYHHENLLPKEVSQILEKLCIDKVDQNVYIGIHNGGEMVTVRPAYAGGGIERGRASHFRKLAEKTRFEYPRTSKVYSDLARSFEGRAADEDRDAQQGELE